ncbi:MAG: 4Fe-4S dicluster domain-containing protein [Planctomycetota bacterium]
MPHVVAEPCERCRYTDCVEVCPVNAFHSGKDMLYINPDECIDCQACVAECPVDAIFYDDDLPDEWKKYIEINAAMSQESELITEKEPPLAES